MQLAVEQSIMYIYALLDTFKSLQSLKYYIHFAHSQ